MRPDTLHGREASSRGRRAEFEREALPHLTALLCRARSLTGGDEAASQDLVQEACLKAFRNWDGYEPETNCRAWLMTILRNEFLNAWRKRGRRGATLDLDELAERLHVEGKAPATPEDEFERVLDDEVADAIRSLPEEFRRPVELRDLAGLTYAEVASELGIVTGTVKSRLHRGRRALRSRLREYARERGYEAA